MNRVVLAMVLAMVLAVGAATMGCASPRQSSGPATGFPRPVSPADTTVIGRVTPEGGVVADTLTGGDPADPRVERETVYAGVIEAAPEEPAAVAGRGPWRVQLYASRERSAADSTAADLRGTIQEPIRVDLLNGWYQVRAGGYPTRAAAEPLRRLLVSRGWADAFIVRAP